MDRDREHLRLLAVFHFVVAGLAALASFFALVMIGAGALALDIWRRNPGDAPPEFGAWLVIALGTFWLLVALTFVAASILAGASLLKTRRYTFCLVVAAVACLFVPFGTILGVSTLVVLNRPSVKALFTGAAQPGAPTTLSP